MSRARFVRVGVLVIRVGVFVCGIIVVMAIVFAMAAPDGFDSALGAGLGQVAEEGGRKLPGEEGGFSARPRGRRFFGGGAGGGEEDGERGPLEGGFGRGAIRRLSGE